MDERLLSETLGTLAYSLIVAPGTLISSKNAFAREVFVLIEFGKDWLVAAIDSDWITRLQ